MGSMKALLLGLFALLATLAVARASCVVSTGTQSLYANVQGSQYICDSLDSDCVHPDPSTYDIEGCNGNLTVPYEQCCASGGEDPQEAQANSLDCTVVLGNKLFNVSQCPTYADYSVEADTGILVLYNPCDRYLGDVVITCSTYRGADDYTGAGPGSLVSTGSFTFQYTAVPCTTCTGGTCDAVTGCICPAGFTGEDCQYAITEDMSSASSSFAGKMGSAGIFFVSAAFGLALGFLGRD